MQFGRAFIAVALAFIAATPVLAQSPDLFQSNPGPAPAPAVQAPRPRPAPRPAPRMAPERVEPPRAAPMVMPAPPPNPAQRFDGFWSGTYNCGQGGPRSGLQSFQTQKTAEIKNGRFELISGVARGTPGSWSLTGTVSPDGSIELSGDSFSSGIPGTPPAGQHNQHRFSGRIQGEQFAATDLAHSDRGCQLTLTRRR